VSSTEVLLESASNNQQSESNVGAFKFDLHFPVKELLEFASHFHPTHPVLFLTFSPELCQNVSNLLNLDQNGPYWNSQSTKEIEKRMTLIPHTLDASAIKEIVSLLCKYCRINELKVAEATRLLQISIPSSDEQKYLDAFNRAMKSIRVSSSTIHKINEVRVLKKVFPPFLNSCHNYVYKRFIRILRIFNIYNIRIFIRIYKSSFVE
jgi:hypothetical protein